MDLLNRDDDASPEVWNLIRSLATNQELYKKVASFSEAKNSEGEIDWEKFFSGSSIYEQIYNLEIIEELIEAGTVGDECKRVTFVEIQKKE